MSSPKKKKKQAVAPVSANNAVLRAVEEAKKRQDAVRSLFGDEIIAPVGQQVSATPTSTPSQSKDLLSVYGDMLKPVADLGKSAGQFTLDTFGKAVKPVADLGASAWESVSDALKLNAGQDSWARDFIDPKLFDDGYDFGDVSRSILGTTMDAGADFIAGIGEGVEGIIDAAGFGGGYIIDKTFAPWFYPLMDEISSFVFGRENEHLAEKMWDSTYSDIIDIVKSDLIKTDEFQKHLRELTGYDWEQESILGEQSDNLVQSVPPLIANYYASAHGFPSWIIPGLNAFGGKAEQVLNEGATDDEAFINALITALAEVGTERISGAILPGGGTSGTDILSKTFSKITGKALPNTAKLLLGVAGEGVEEMLAEDASTIADWMTHKSDQDLIEMLTSDEAWKNRLYAGLGGMILGSGSEAINIKQTGKSGRDAVTGLTANEETVVQAETERRAAEYKADGKKANIDKIRAEVIEAMKRGDISLEAIESYLGGEVYRRYTEAKTKQKGIQEELKRAAATIDALYGKGDLTEQEQAELDKAVQSIGNLSAQEKALKVDDARQNLHEYVNNLTKTQGDAYLRESYSEAGKRGEGFKTDKVYRAKNKKNQAAVNATIESAKKAGLNNTRRVHELVDFAAKISADTGLVFDLSNSKRIKDAFVQRQTADIQKLEAIPEAERTAAQKKTLEEMRELLEKVKSDDITINGTNSGKSITLNLDSPNPLNRIAGHEISHSLENAKAYDALRDSLLAYAKSKGVDTDKLLGEYRKRYQGANNADAEREMIADMVGDYLFSDENFVKHLTKNRNLFQRVYDEIKYLLKLATTGSQEARELERVKHLFDKAYKQMAAGTDTTTQYSFSSMAHTFFGNEDMSTLDWKKADYKSTEGYQAYVDKCLDNYRQTRPDFDEASARKYIEKSIDGIVRVAIAAKEAGYDIYDDAKQRNKHDSKHRLLFSSLEPNSDYITSHDISTICDKRKNFTEIYEDIVRAEEKLGVPENKRFFHNVDNYFYIHQVMAEKGLTTPCRECYVESMRKNLAPMAESFMSLVKETDGNNKANAQLYHQKGKDKGKLKVGNAETREFVLAALEEYGMTPGDLSIEKLSTAPGLAELKVTAPKVYEAFNSFYGQSKPKMPRSATPFRFGELTALLTDDNGKINKRLVEKINHTGGFRLQSYSDFQVENFTDVLQVLFEAGTLGLNGHAYTKVPAFLEATDNTNLKRNISIFMYKDGDQWKLDRNDSFPYTLEEIYKLVDADKSGNTGIIAVSQNAEMSAWIMANDHIGYGIPYHKSGQKMDVVRSTVVRENGREIKGYSEAKDHTRQQSEVWAKANSDHKALTKVKKGIDIYEFWDFDNQAGLSKTQLIERNVKAYLDACEEAGYLPKFREYVLNNQKVLEDVLRYSKELGFAAQDATIDDISFRHEVRDSNGKLVRTYRVPYGYYKFLGDFGMFTPDGKASPQKTLSLEDYDFDKAVDFFADAETLRRNEILQQFANGKLREQYRNSDLTTEELKQLAKKKRDEVVREVVGDDIAPVSYSLSENPQKVDADYIDAVNRGDMETAQRMVDEAAKKAGFPAKVFHGTPWFGFTKPDVTKSNDRISFFATDSLETARTYSGTSGVRRISDTTSSSLGVYQFYANTSGALEVDANGAESNHIELGQIEHDFNSFLMSKSWRSHATAKQLAKYAKENGYTGVVIKNVIDTATPDSRKSVKPANVYIFFNPNEQVKSADPVTYDDSGNVIPLSQRFNPNNNDIRYSLSDSTAPLATVNNFDTFGKDPKRQGYSSDIAPVKAEAKQNKVDADYTDAVNRGDMETAQRMVDEAAKKSGYSVKAYHGTYNFGRTVFDLHDVLFLTDSEYTAKNFSGGLGRRLVSSGTFDPDTAPIEQVADYVARNTGWGDLEPATVEQVDDVLPRFTYTKKEIKKYGISQDLVKRAAEFTKRLHEVRTDIENGIPYWTGINVEGIGVPNSKLAGESWVRKVARENIAIKGNSGGAYELRINPGNTIVVDGGGEYYASLPVPAELRGYARPMEIAGATTDQIVRMAYDAGYDSVTFKDIREGGDYGDAGVSTVYAVFNPTQRVKSADPVTYDDSGNVIPLSQRFNPNNNDIRYSLSDSTAPLAPVNNFDTFGKDLKRDGYSSDTAPVKAEARQNIAPVKYSMTDNGGQKPVVDHIREKMEKDLANLRERYEPQIEKYKGMADSKEETIGKLAWQLLSELQTMEKGKKVSWDLGYLLDHTVKEPADYRSLDIALKNIRDNPLEVVNPRSKAERFARQMLERQWQEMLDYASDLEQEYRQSIEDLATQANQELDSAAGKPVAPIAQNRPAGSDVAPVAPTSQEVTEEKKAPTINRVMANDGPKAKQKKGSLTMKLRNTLVDKGSVIDDISIETGNPELIARYKSINNAAAKAQHMIGNGDAKAGVKALTEIQKNVKKVASEAEFDDYMYNQLNVDRMTMMTRYPGRHDIPVFGPEYSAAESRAKVQEYEAKHPEFRGLANDVYAFVRNNQNLMIQEGFITRDTANLWGEMYPHYIPIERASFQDKHTHQDGRTGAYNPVKKLTGSEKELRPMFTAIADQTIAVQKAIAKNRFGKELRRMLNGVEARETASTGPADGILQDGTIVYSEERGINGKVTGYDESRNQYSVQFKYDNGRTEEVWMNPDQVSQMAPDTAMDEAMRGFFDSKDLLKPAKGEENPIFTVFENGKRIEFEITPDIYDALKPTSDAMSAKIPVLSQLTNARKRILTDLNPVFWLTNTPKDIQAILPNSKHPGATYGNLPNAAFQIASKGKWYMEYVENGGKQQSYFNEEERSLEKEPGTAKRILTGPARFIRSINESLEMMPRLAEYIASRKKGASIDVAMLDAARVTTDFSAAGDFSRMLNRNFVPFLTASISGSAQQVRNFREAKAKGAKGIAGYIMRQAIATIPLAIFNHLMWEDDEAYAETLDYVKQNYYLVGKTDDGNFIRIPKGREVAVIQDFYEQMANLVTGNFDDVDIGSFAKLAMTNIAPNNPIDNNILAPIIQAHTGKTWYGEDLIPSRLQKVPNAEQYDESTDAISKWIGEMTGMSPYRINYILDQYSGGFGDVILPMLTSEAESGSDTIGGKLLAPLADKFTVDSTMKNQYVSDFYDKVDELEINSNSQNATDEDILMSAYMNGWNSAIGDLYGLRRKVNSAVTVGDLQDIAEELKPFLDSSTDPGLWYALNYGNQNAKITDSSKYQIVRSIQRMIDDRAKKALETYQNVSIDGGYATVGTDHYLKKNDKWSRLSSDEVAEQKLMTKVLGIKPEMYWNSKAALSSFRNDKDANGNAIDGTRKAKIIDWINSQDMPYEAKIILYKSQYTGDHTYDAEIIEYLQSNPNITYDQMVAILKGLKLM